MPLLKTGNNGLRTQVIKFCAYCKQPWLMLRAGMQIEESFRDLKSQRFGLGFSSSRTTQKNRLSVLLLVASLALFVLRLIGEVGKAKQMAFKFQSNTRRSRPVLSVITLALQLVRHGMAAFPPREFNAALERLRNDHPALQL